MFLHFILFYLVFNILLPHISLLFTLFPFSCRPPHFLSSSTLFRVSFSSLSRIAKEWKPMHFSLSLSHHNRRKQMRKQTMQMSSIRNSRGGKLRMGGREETVCASRGGRERGETVLDAFAKPLETVLHNNLLEKWQRDAKMSETTTNSDDFFPLTVNLTLTATTLSEAAYFLRLCFLSFNFATLRFIIPKDKR